MVKKKKVHTFLFNQQEVACKRFATTFPVPPQAGQTNSPQSDRERSRPVPLHRLHAVGFSLSLELSGAYFFIVIPKVRVWF